MPLWASTPSAPAWMLVFSPVRLTLRRCPRIRMCDSNTHAHMCTTGLPRMIFISLVRRRWSSRTGTHSEHVKRWPCTVCRMRPFPSGIYRAYIRHISDSDHNSQWLIVTPHMPCGLNWRWLLAFIERSPLEERWALHRMLENTQWIGNAQGIPCKHSIHSVHFVRNERSCYTPPRQPGGLHCCVCVLPADQLLNLFASNSKCSSLRARI